MSEWPYEKYNFRKPQHLFIKIKDTWIMWCAKDLPAKRKTVTLIKEFP